MTSKLVVEQTLGLALLLSMAYWWTGLPEGSIPQVILSVAVLLIVVGGIAALTWRAVRHFRATGPPPSAAQAGVALAALAASIFLGRWLIGWVPGVEGFGLQAASMVLRFGIAYLAVVLSWLHLVRVAARGR